MTGYDTVTIGKVFSATFDDPKWEFFETKKGEKIVEFSGKISEDLHQDIVNKIKQELNNNPTVKANLILLNKSGIDYEKVKKKLGCVEDFCNDKNPDLFVDEVINEFQSLVLGR